MSGWGQAYFSSGPANHAKQVGGCPSVVGVLVRRSPVHPPLPDPRRHSRRRVVSWVAEDVGMVVKGNRHRSWHQKKWKPLGAGSCHSGRQRCVPAPMPSLKTRRLRTEGQQVGNGYTRGASGAGWGPGLGGRKGGIRLPPRPHSPQWDPPCKGAGGGLSVTLSAGCLDAGDPKRNVRTTNETKRVSGSFV